MENLLQSQEILHCVILTPVKVVVKDACLHIMYVVTRMTCIHT